jgi:signal transduction histidine kinase
MAEPVRILMVDDRPENLLTLRSILDVPGYTLVEAGSAPEALIQVLRQDFAVMLIDVVMPGMDGFEMATMVKARAKSNHIPIIFLTAYATEIQHVYQGYAAGAVDYLSQPLDPAIVRAKVAVFVDLYLKTRQVREQMVRLAAIEGERLRLEQEARRAAERDKLRSEFLAEVSKRLFVPLDRQQMSLSQVAAVAVRYLCDWCVIDRTDDAGQLVQAALTHGDPDRQRHARAWVRYPGPATVGNGPGAAGQVGRMEAAALAALLGVADVAQVAALGVRCVLRVPLEARGRDFGVITMVVAAGDRQFDDKDLQVARSFAHRVAMALDNERLYRAAQAAVQARADLLAVVSHDLKNPLAAIAMNAAYLITLTKGKAAGKIRERVERIQRLADMMLHQIRDLLDMSSLEAGRLSMARQFHELAPLVAEAVELLKPLATDKAIGLKTELPDRSIWVHCDRARIIQVFSNLIGNAVKFTPDNGTVTVTAGVVNGEVRFAVRDTGPGIPAKQLPLLFERYWKGRSSSLEGSGLGLSIAKGIVDAHGGRIWACSPPEGGSIFQFTLPRFAYQLPRERAA